MSSFKEIPATELSVGDVLALPFKRTATISEVSVGLRFVNFRTEHGKGRIDKYETVLVETDDAEDLTDG